MSETVLEADLAEELEEANNTLLLAPSFAGGDEETCIELLGPDASAANMLWVSYTKSPDAQLQRWRNHRNEQPENLAIVTVEDSTRSVAADAGGSGGVPGPTGPVETVNNPNDLTGLGISVTEYITDWADDDRPTAVCFDSLTALLQYVELETAYEFLHILTGRLAAVDASAHFHMDPDAHDDQTVQSIMSLMDAVVELTDDGRKLRSRNL